jgi:hypothetical protein
MNYKKIFKSIPDKDRFVQLLLTINMVDNNKYIFYDELYKKEENYINDYFFTIKNNYHNSKREFIDDLNFKKCMTAIKQLCRIHDIEYINKRKYFNNTYKIYYIFGL